MWKLKFPYVRIMYVCICILHVCMYITLTGMYVYICSLEVRTLAQVGESDQIPKPLLYLTDHATISWLDN